MTLAPLFDGFAISCPRSTQSKETRRQTAGRRRRSNHRRTVPLAAPFLTSWPRATPIRLLPDRRAAHSLGAPEPTGPAYKEHSHCKVCRAAGADRLAASSKIRLGLMACCRFGIRNRTHPAEETYHAGRSAFWNGDTPYRRLTGERSHHPSGPHATRTGDAAFMSIYIWDGDISTENYRYYGTTED